MNDREGLDLRTAILLLIGGAGTYIAFLHPALGIALAVGISLVTVAHVLLK